MIDDNTLQPLDDDLHTSLSKLFVIGFLDAMAGRPVEDEDCIPSELSLTLIQIAGGCIDRAEAFIGEIFPENPQTCYDAAYQAGFDICTALSVAYGPMEIYLN